MTNSKFCAHHRNYELLWKLAFCYTLHIGHKNEHFWLKIADFCTKMLILRGKFADLAIKLNNVMRKMAVHFLTLSKKVILGKNTFGLALWWPIEINWYTSGLILLIKWSLMKFLLHVASGEREQSKTWGLIQQLSFFQEIQKGQIGCPWPWNRFIPTHKWNPKTRCLPIF